MLMQQQQSKSPAVEQMHCWQHETISYLQSTAFPGWNFAAEPCTHLPAT